MISISRFIQCSTLIIINYIFFRFPLECRVNGLIGDGSEQGPCANGDVCYSDGRCGTCYKHAHNFQFNLNIIKTWFC